MTKHNSFKDFIIVGFIEMTDGSRQSVGGSLVKSSLKTIVLADIN